MPLTVSVIRFVRKFAHLAIRGIKFPFIEDLFRIGQNFKTNLAKHQLGLLNLSREILILPPLCGYFDFYAF